MSKIAIISDLHLTENRYDRYRWEVWPWIRQEIDKYKCNKLYILGDLLDKKDRHPSELVNELVDEIAKCAKLVPVTILKGNHDYLKPEHPFIKFIEWLDNVYFITEPFFSNHEIWLPHSKNPEEEWKKINFKDAKYRYIFMHQSVIGSQVSNYHEMKSGLSTTIFKNTPAKIFSGDIHVPQDIPISGAQSLTYIGTPYPIAFGDNYEPRGLILDDVTNKVTEINLQTIQKLHLKIKNPDELEALKLKIKEEDQIKITLLLSNSEILDWPKYKKKVQTLIEAKGAILRDIKLEKLEETKQITKSASQNLRQESPKEILLRYGSIEKINSNILNAGLELIGELSGQPVTDRLQQHANPIIERKQRTKL